MTDIDGFPTRLDYLLLSLFCFVVSYHAAKVLYLEFLLRRRLKKLKRMFPELYRQIHGEE